jgi:hypothetical protein
MARLFAAPPDDEFASALRARLDVGDRPVTIDRHTTQDGPNYYVKFYNLPRRFADNWELANRNLIDFAARSTLMTPQHGRLSVESQSWEGLTLKAKHASPSAIAKHLADYINKFAREVEPDLGARSNPSRQKPAQAPARMARAGLPRDWLTAVDVIVATRSSREFRSCDPSLVTFYLLGLRYPKFTADKIRRLSNLMLSSHPPGR